MKSRLLLATCWIMILGCSMVSPKSDVMKTNFRFNLAINDHPKFIAFLEAYYKWLEESGETLDEIKNIKHQFDIDSSESPFIDKLYTAFLKLIPQNIAADKNLLLKHIKDYLAAKCLREDSRKDQKVRQSQN